MPGRHRKEKPPRQLCGEACPLCRKGCILIRNHITAKHECTNRHRWG